MKAKIIVAISLVTLTLVSITQAASPTPAPTVKPSPSPSPSPKRHILDDGDFTPKTTPVRTPPELAVPMESPATIQGVPPSPNVNPPKPVLYLIGSEPYTVSGRNFIRYRYDVFNKMDYPADMFAAAPTLPPCGLNPNASRTWVDIFDSTGRRIYGFCALSKPADLGKIWFALEEGVVPPSYVYIELNDRQTNTKYKSNLADTTL